MLPPGRAMLSTRPVTVGSETPTITIGMLVVASLAARVPSVPWARIIATFSRTSSAASAPRRS